MNEIRHPYHKYETFFMWTVIVLWLTSQIISVLHLQNTPQISDALRYETLASECISRGAWYPMPEQISGLPDNPTYICYAGLINFIIICIRVFGTYKAVFWFNILFNGIILTSLYRITAALSGRSVARIAVCLFCLCPQNVFYLCGTMSELPCMALAYLSVAMIGNRRYLILLLSGVLMAAAIYVRSVAALFAISPILYMILKKYRLKSISTYVIGIVFGCMTVSAINQTISGEYRFISSTTLGINMLIGANDYCHGFYNSQILDDKLEEELTGNDVFRCDSIYRAHAIEWIKDNTVKWLLLSPAKIKCQLGVDKNYPLGLIYSYVYQSLLYLAALYGLWIRRKRIFGIDCTVLLPFISSLLLAILTVGGARYNFPFVPCLIYFAAVASDLLLRNVMSRYNIISR